MTLDDTIKQVLELEKNRKVFSELETDCLLAQKAPLLAKACQKMKEALQFYADEKHLDDINCDDTFVELGTTAKSALADIEKMFGEKE